jgi:hypothetical protein
MNRTTVSACANFSAVLNFPAARPRTLAQPVALALLLAAGLSGVTHGQVIGFWQFNEKSPGNTSDTTAGAILDASGNANHGTTALPLSYTAGNAAYGTGAALAFTLSPDNVVVPDPSGVFNFSPGQSITLEALVRTYNIGQDSIGAIMNKQVASPGEWWWRINANGRQQFWIDDGSGSGTRNVSGNKALNDGQWHHVAAVYDATAQQVRVYVDYVLDGSANAIYGTAGTIGNSSNLWIGAYQAGNRQFDGDMDFARISLGALAPSGFVQPATYLANFSPTNDASFHSPATIASFAVKSPTVGVAPAGIVVTMNGSNVTSQLGLTGNNNDRTVTLPALAANTFYRVNITVTDLGGFQFTQAWVFNTFANSLFFIEGEDYNFDGGQFLDNPQLSSVPGPDNYLDRLSTEGIDVHQTNTPALAQYRIGDIVGTAVSLDELRADYVAAKIADPGVADYMARDHANTEWLNYTRTFPSGTYRVFARLAKAGTVPVVLQLDEVTSGSTTASQTLAPLGSFRRAPTGSDADYEFVPLTDAVGKEVGVPLSGVKTLRLTMVSGTAGVNLNYFVFVPISGTQAPFLAAVSPAAGAGNEVFNATLAAMIRDADTTVNTGTIQLRLDGATVAPSVTPTGIGANVSYTPSVMSTGLHTATLIFTDSAAASITNQWQFYVANKAVRGYWKFDELAVGNFASTNTGAILDASGNTRHGTVNVGTMPYVSGSFNYGNSRALRFTSGPDRVVVPDPAGNFNFTNSFTIESLVRSTNTATVTGAILAKNGLGDGEGELWWRFPGLTGGKQRVGMNNQLLLGGAATLNDGVWHHLAIVYDQPANQVRLYADYALDASASFTPDRPIGRPADLHIGSFIGGGSDFEGEIDFIRVSDGALSTNQFVQRVVALQPIVKTQTPANAAMNVSPYVTVSVDFQNRDTAAVLSSLRLLVDSIDVTAASSKTGSATNAKISYVPITPLANGAHTATALFDDTAVPANSWTNTWTFTNLATLPVLAFYQFNEKPAGNTADTTTDALLDFSGLAHHATMIVTNAPPLPLDYVTGSPDHGATPALAFATNKSVRLVIPDPANVFSFWPTQGITLETVMRTVNIGQAGQGIFLSKQIASPGEWYWRLQNTRQQRFAVNDGTGLRTVTGTKLLNDGQWHHLAAVYDPVAKQIRVYVDYVLDGAPVATTFTTLIGNTTDLWIGQQQSGTSKLDGDIDMIRVTSAALDPSWFIPLGGVPSPVRLVNVNRSGANISFSFATEAGRSYIVQSAAAIGGAWGLVETIPGDGTIKTVSYTISPGGELFRVKTQ